MSESQSGRASRDLRLSLEDLDVDEQGKVSISNPEVLRQLKQLKQLKGLRGDRLGEVIGNEPGTNTGCGLGC